MYKALEAFVDLQDASRVYHPGDEFPRKGLNVSEERLAELSSPNNKRGRPVIVFVKDYTPAEPSISPKKATKTDKGTNTPKATKKAAETEIKPKRSRKKNAE